MKFPGFITRIRRAIANELRAGNDVYRLQRLDDRLLVDIGVARADIDGRCLAIRSADAIPGSEALGRVTGIPPRGVHASFEPAPAQ